VRGRDVTTGGAVRRPRYGSWTAQTAKVYSSGSGGWSQGTGSSHERN